MPTHLCLISRASPCHCDVMPCETVHWNSHEYWSHIMDSLQRMPCGFLQHMFLLRVPQPDAWMPDGDGSQLALLGHQVHAKIKEITMNRAPERSKIKKNDERWKIKLFLCIPHRNMGEWKYNYLHSSLTPALELSLWSASCNGCCTARRTTPVTDRIGQAPEQV